MGALVSIGYGQSIKIQGKVTNANNQPIAGARLELTAGKQTVNAGNDGAYTFSTVGVFQSHAGVTGPIMQLNNGILEFMVNEEAPVKVDLFDAQGNHVDHMNWNKAAIGSYQVDLTGKALTEKLHIVKVSVGKVTQSFTYMPLKVVALGMRQSIQAHTNSRGSLAKAAAIIDTLKVSATGYISKSLPVTSYDTIMNVVLETASDRWGGLKNPAVKSAGCGKALGTLKTGKYKIMSGNTNRDYTIDIPTNYDPQKPYRLIFAFHWVGGNDDMISEGLVEFAPGSGPDYAYYGLKRLANLANEPAIFIAPRGLNGRWGQEDHPFFDNLLNYANTNLCIDSTRVFATGFSFGGMITYSLSTAKQNKIRAAVGLGPANFNIWLPNPLPRDPIAWMSVTGMSDQTTPWVNANNQNQGARAIALHRAQDNGCTVPTSIPTTNVGSRTHMCYDFSGCKSGYPVKACTFDGGHIANVGDGTTSNAGKDSWVPGESWKFFSQF